MGASFPLLVRRDKCMLLLQTSQTSSSILALGAIIKHLTSDHRISGQDITDTLNSKQLPLMLFTLEWPSAVKK